MNSPLVMCAIDLGASTRRVLFHAVGMARVLGADLRILHVSADDDGTSVSRNRILEACEQAAPYEAAIDPETVLVASGRVSEAIQREALQHKATLVVMGSRGYGGLTRLLLGSTSEEFLALTRTPVLLVPPNDFDIVSLGDRAALTCGPILAPVDLAEACAHQLQMASELAKAGSQTLIFLTVVSSQLSDHDAAAQLRDRAHGLAPVKPTSLIVRRGEVAEEISRCASAEGAGLVVMGLRERPRGRPGLIASAVLKTGRAFVLAVPGC